MISLKSRELVAKHATIISDVSNMPTFIHFGNQYLVIISLKSRELVAKHTTIISGVSNMPTFIHFGNQLIIKIISY